MMIFNLSMYCLYSRMVCVQQRMYTVAWVDSLLLITPVETRQMESVNRTTPHSMTNSYFRLLLPLSTWYFDTSDLMCITHTQGVTLTMSGTAISLWNNAITTATIIKQLPYYDIMMLRKLLYTSMQFSYFIMGWNRSISSFIARLFIARAFIARLWRHAYIQPEFGLITTDRVVTSITLREHAMNAMPIYSMFRNELMLTTFDNYQ